jgi:hypothetical protein
MAVRAWTVVNGASVEAMARHRRAGAWAANAPHAAAVLVVGGVTLVVAGSLMPWVRTGARRRSSYQLVAIADRLGVLPSGLDTVVARGWVFIPLLAAVSVAAVVLGRLFVAGITAIVTGLYTVVMAWTVASSPLWAQRGVSVTVVGGIIAVLGGGALALTARTARRSKAEMT